MPFGVYYYMAAGFDNYCSGLWLQITNGNGKHMLF